MAIWGSFDLGLKGLGKSGKVKLLTCNEGRNFWHGMQRENTDELGRVSW